MLRFLLRIPFASIASPYEYHTSDDICLVEPYFIYIVTLWNVKCGM